MAVVVAMVFAALVGSVGSASAAPAAPAAVTCPPGVFCGWEFDNFTGSHFTQSKCGVKVPIPSGWWIATGGAFQGSYWNNQTGHAVARFYNSNGNEVRPSSTAVQKVSTFAWGSPITTVRVAYVIVC